MPVIELNDLTVSSKPFILNCVCVLPWTSDNTEPSGMTPAAPSFRVVPALTTVEPVYVLAPLPPSTSV